MDKGIMVAGNQHEPERRKKWQFIYLFGDLTGVAASK